VGVAVAAHSIAKTSPHPVMANEIFVAGMIHDIGTLVERQVFPDQFSEVINICMTGDHEFLETERRIIGADHQAFGVGLTTKWKFPRHLRATVGFHHNPGDLSAELRNIATAIQLADILCSQDEVGFYLTQRTGEITEEMLDTLGITRAQVEEVRVGLADQITEAEVSLGA
jgi:HD-like signal output (HDOD) protein